MQTRPAQYPTGSRWEGESGCLEPGDRSRSLPHQTPSREGRGVIAVPRATPRLRWPRLPRPRSRHARTGFLFSRPSAHPTERTHPTRTIVAMLGARALMGLMVLARALQSQVPGELRGRITDVESGRAIAGARVELGGRTEFALSDISGVYVLRGLEPGTL